MSEPTPEEIKVFIRRDPEAAAYLAAVEARTAQHFGGTGSGGGGEPRVSDGATVDAAVRRTTEDELYRQFFSRDPAAEERIRVITGTADDADLVEVPAEELERLRAEAAFSEDSQYRSFYGGR